MHHLQARTNTLPASAYVGSHTVIDVNVIMQQHAGVMPNLLTVHALTECDITAYMATIGKATTFKLQERFSAKVLIPQKWCNLTPTSPAATAFKHRCKRPYFHTALWKGYDDDAPPNHDPKQFAWLATSNVLEVV